MPDSVKKKTSSGPKTRPTGVSVDEFFTAQE